MSHRQSCDRCRQQKVRCLRDDTQRGDSNSSSSRASLARCERCMKAGVECVSSLSNIVKQRSNRRPVQTSLRKDSGPGPKNLDSASWFDQGQTEPSYAGGPSLGANYTDLIGPFPGDTENGAAFNRWDANLQLFSPTSMNSITAPFAVDVAPISIASPSIDGRENSEESDEDKDPADALSSQLASLSARATRATRRLVRPGRGSPTVLSPEVNEALESTSTLIRIVHNITAPDRGNVKLDSTTTNYGLAFSALACHQSLIALFRTICNAINRCLQIKKQYKQLYHRSRQHSDTESFSVAQSVMVLQLLIHLTNRMDRTLFQDQAGLPQGTRSSTDCYNTPVTPSIAKCHNTVPTPSEVAIEGPSSHGGLLALVQDITRTVSNEHKQLKQLIQQLQTEMEHSELH